VILTDFEKYLMAWSIARFLCDSWASCRLLRHVHTCCQPSATVGNCL